MVAWLAQSGRRTVTLSAGAPRPLTATDRSAPMSTVVARPAAAWGPEVDASTPADAGTITQGASAPRTVAVTPESGGATTSSSYTPGTRSSADTTNRADGATLVEQRGRDQVVRHHHGIGQSEERPGDRVARIPGGHRADVHTGRGQSRRPIDDGDLGFPRARHDGGGHREPRDVALEQELRGTQAGDVAYLERLH